MANDIGSEQAKGQTLGACTETQTCVQAKLKEGE